MSHRYVTSLPVRNMLICMLLDEGLTVGELLALNRKDVMTSNMDMLRVGERLVTVGDGTAGCLLSYLSLRRDGDPALLLSLRRRRLTRRGIYAALHAGAARGVTL